MKRDVGIAYLTIRKILYNVMRFKETLSVDEAEVLAGTFSSVSGRHYVLHDPEKRAEKYQNAWNNIAININHLQDNTIISFLSFQNLLNPNQSLNISLISNSSSKQFNFKIAISDFQIMPLY
jgi:hypothetical protein